MARRGRYVMTPKRRIALRKAQLASARKRRKGVSGSGNKSRRRKAIAVGVLGAGGLAAARHSISGSQAFVSNQKWKHTGESKLAQFGGNMPDGTPILLWGTPQHRGIRFDSSGTIPGRNFHLRADVFGRRLIADYQHFKVKDRKVGHSKYQKEAIAWRKNDKKRYKTEVRAERQFKRSVKQGIKTTPVTRTKGRKRKRRGK